MMTYLCTHRLKMDNNFVVHKKGVHMSDNPHPDFEKGFADAGKITPVMYGEIYAKD